MNRKLTVRNEFGEMVSCVLSDKESFEKQMMDVLSLHAGAAFRLISKTIRLLLRIIIRTKRLEHLRYYLLLKPMRALF